MHGRASKKSHCLFSSMSTHAKSVSSRLSVVCRVKSSGPPAQMMTFGFVLSKFTLLGCVVDGIRSLTSPRGFACSVPVTVSVLSVSIVEKCTCALHAPGQSGAQYGLIDIALLRIPKVRKLLYEQHLLKLLSPAEHPGCALKLKVCCCCVIWLGCCTVILPVMLGCMSHW